MSSNKVQRKPNLNLVRDVATREALDTLSRNFDEVFRRLNRVRSVVSDTCASFSTTSSSLVDVPNLRVKIDLTGKKPVRLYLRQKSEPISPTLISAGGIKVLSTSISGCLAGVSIRDGANSINAQFLGGGINTVVAPANYECYYPACSIQTMDERPSPGLHEYWVQTFISIGPGTVLFTDVELVAEEDI